jgi:hypothetical protein
MVTDGVLVWWAAFPPEEAVARVAAVPDFRAGFKNLVRPSVRGEACFGSGRSGDVSNEGTEYVVCMVAYTVSKSVRGTTTSAHARSILQPQTRRRDESSSKLGPAR